MKKIVKERKFTSKSNAHCCTISDISAVGWVGTPDSQPTQQNRSFFENAVWIRNYVQKIKIFIENNREMNNEHFSMFKV
jgi:hypothetical protein